MFREPHGVSRVGMKALRYATRRREVPFLAVERHEGAVHITSNALEAATSIFLAGACAFPGTEPRYRRGSSFEPSYFRLTALARQLKNYVPAYLDNLNPFCVSCSQVRCWYEAYNIL